jgi:hypothetical protein
MEGDYMARRKAYYTPLGVRKTKRISQHTVRMPHDIEVYIESGHNEPARCQQILAV